MPQPGSVSARGPEKPKILVFFDFACQFCYLDWPRFKRLRDMHDVELVLVPYELRPRMPPDGLLVSDAGGAHSPRVEEYMRRMAEEASRPLVFPDFVPNTHMALRLGEYARDLGAETHEAVHEAIFAAYSGNGEDIGRVEVLVGIAESLGLDSGDARSAIEGDGYDSRLHQFYHFAMAIGVSATPAALICNELFIGSRPLGVLQQSLERCLVNAEKIESGDASVDDPALDAGPTSNEPDEGAPPTLDR